LLAVAVAVALLGSVAAARAQPPTDPQDMRWNERWPRFRTAEYVATGVMLAGVGVGLLAVPQRENAWTRGNVVDDWFRDRLVLGNVAHRTTAVVVGDVFYYGLSFYPVVVDVGIAALAVHQSPDIAWQMFAVDAQSYALTGLLSTFTQKLVGRTRPFAAECDTDPNYDPDCDEPETISQSLLSGHTAMAFTGAGLMCAHHQHLALYGDRAADVLACSVGIAGAVVVGGSRVVADRHYLSDAVAGALVGFGSGYLLPELLHYGFDRNPISLRTQHVMATVIPLFSPTSIGWAVVGWR
jgi:membrane-associated phospholipid phosphatase